MGIFYYFENGKIAKGKRRSYWGVIYAMSNIADLAEYAFKSSYLELFLKDIDGFIHQNLTNTYQDKSLLQIVASVKDFIFIFDSD